MEPVKRRRERFENVNGCARGGALIPSGIFDGKRRGTAAKKLFTFHSAVGKEAERRPLLYSIMRRTRERSVRGH